MACANVLGVCWIGALAQGVCDLDALLGRERDILLDVPAVRLPKAAAFFYDSLHATSVPGGAHWSNAKSGPERAV